MCIEKDFNIIEVGHGSGKGNKKYFKRNTYINTEELEEFINENDNKGIYKTAYNYNTDDIEKAELIGDFYLDFDCIEDFESVREDVISGISYIFIVYKIPKDQIQLYFSGSKGIHLIIDKAILDIQPLKNLNEIFKYMAESIYNFTPNKTLDIRVYDNRRLFRIENSIHEKTNLHKIPITYDELKTLSQSDIKELAREKRHIPKQTYSTIQYSKKRYESICDKANEEIEKKNKNVKSNGTLKYTPPCIKHIIENGATEGNRNNTLAALASYYRNRGYDLDSTIKYCTNWNNIRLTNSLNNSEVIKTVKSVYLGKKNYGCASLKFLGDCNEKECKLKSGEKKNGRHRFKRD